MKSFQEIHLHSTRKSLPNKAKAYISIELAANVRSQAAKRITANASN